MISQINNKSTSKFVLILISKLLPYAFHMCIQTKGGFRAQIAA
jgi:hypothetical protein